MRLNTRRRSPYGDGHAHTYCEVDGKYFDDVLVRWYSSPAEPDVNWPGDFEITGVYLEDQGDVMYDMTDGEIEDLRERMQELAFPDPSEEY